MSRSILLFPLLLMLAVSSAASVEFVTPLPAGQAVGAALIEVRIDSAGVDKVNFYVDGVLVGVARQQPWRMIHDFGTSLTAHRVEAEVFSDRFRKVERTTVTTAGQSASDTIEVNLVEVPIRVTGAKRQLSAADLRVSENGVAQKIAEVRADRLPTSFVFVVDRSLSMGHGKLPAAFQAIQNALEKLRPGDDAQLVLFSHRVEPSIMLASGRDLPSAERVPPAGGTSLRDAILSVRPGRRSAVIVISDGGDRNSSVGEESALRSIGSGNTVLYAIALGGGNGASFLQRAAERTGGSFTRSSADSLPRDLLAVMADINSRYTVVYQSNQLTPGWREIRLTTRQQVELRAAKRGYFAR